MTARSLAAPSCQPYQHDTRRLPAALVTSLVPASTTEHSHAPGHTRRASDSAIRGQTPASAQDSHQVCCRVREQTLIINTVSPRNADMHSCPRAAAYDLASSVSRSHLENQSQYYIFAHAGSGEIQVMLLHRLLTQLPSIQQHIPVPYMCIHTTTGGRGLLASCSPTTQHLRSTTMRGPRPVDSFGIGGAQHVNATSSSSASSHRRVRHGTRCDAKSCLTDSTPAVSRTRSLDYSGGSATAQARFGNDDHQEVAA